MRANDSRNPTATDRRLDQGMRVVTRGVAISVVASLFAIAVVVGWRALPAIGDLGLAFLVDETWAPNLGEYGIAPHIAGTLYSSGLALVVATIFGVAIAILLTQEFLPPKIEVFLKNTVELLAAIPSVVYGLWGYSVLIPHLEPVADWLHTTFPAFPLFSTELRNVGMAPAALVLAIMVLPTITAVSRDAIASVPDAMRHAAYGLGATRWQTILRVVLPTAKSGVFGAVVLGFGRALGETMALAMLVGNAHTFSFSLFSPGNTLAALLANSVPEAGDFERGALMYAALVLLLITLAVNVFGAAVLERATRGRKSREAVA